MNVNALRNIYNAIEIKDMGFDAFVRGYAEAIKPISKGEVMEVQLANVRRKSRQINTRRRDRIILPN